MLTTDGVQEGSALDDAVLDQGMQAAPLVARGREHDLSVFLAPWLAGLDPRLDPRLDKRLVRPFVRGIVARLEGRNRAHGLLLSERGAYVLDPAHAPAGTKRRSNWLRSPHWAASDRSASLWQQADPRGEALEATGETPVVSWVGELGQQRAGETGKPGRARSGRGALQQSPAPHADHARLLPPAQPSPVRAGLAVAGPAAAGAQWAERTAHRRAHALVEPSRPPGQ